MNTYPDEPTRYIVSRRSPGLGDKILSALVCWHYARLTSRVLVIDWRWQSGYLLPFGNLFDKLFEQPDLGPVQVVCNDTVGELPFAPPFAPDAFDSSNIHSMPQGPNLPRVLARQVDIPANTIVASRQVPPNRAGISDSLRKEFMKALIPRPEHLTEIRDFQQEQLGAGAIGIHLRYGNGEFDCIPRRAVSSLEEYVENVVSVIRGISDHVNRPVLLCTDTSAVADRLRWELPGVVQREKWLPVSGAIHRGSNVLEGGLRPMIDAMIDMWLLAQCEYLICSRESRFTAVARAYLDPSKITPIDTCGRPRQHFAQEV